MDKNIRGTRIAYDILCEFLHPNVGDLYGTTLKGESHADAHGTHHLSRNIGIGPKNVSGIRDQWTIAAKLLDVCVDIIAHLPSVFAKLETILATANEMTRAEAHRMYKRNRAAFKKHDLCPCLSGLQIKDCARRKASIKDSVRSMFAMPHHEFE